MRPTSATIWPEPGSAPQHMINRKTLHFGATPKERSTPSSAKPLSSSCAGPALRPAGGIAFALVLLVCAKAFAHDPPHGSGVIRQGQSVLVRTNRGLVLSHDGSTGFQLLCNEALGINTSEIPSVAARSGGGYLIGTSHGLLSASADLCTIDAVAPLDMIAVPALAQDPNDAKHLVASTGQANVKNGLYTSEDGGTTFSSTGPRVTDFIYDHLQVSPLGKDVLLASGLRLRADMMGFDWFFAESTDAGKSFTQHPFSLHDDEYALELLGADPTSTAAVFGVAHAELGIGVLDRFLVSHDHAAAFTSPLGVDRLSAFAITEDAKTLWVGGRNGFWRSRDGGKTFTQLTTRAGECAALYGTTLYVCDERAGTAGLSVSTDEGDTLTTVMAFTDVTTMVPCPLDSKVAIACSGPFSDWRRELMLGFQLDGGVPRSDAGAGLGDAGASSAGTGATDAAGSAKKHGGSGCATALPPHDRTAPSTSLSGLGVLILWRVRRRTRRPGGGAQTSLPEARTS